MLQWTKQQSPSERLAGHILRLEGFKSLDPSHPLGGKDGLKDLVALREGERWIAAAYFPRGQQSISEIKKKFKDDFEGVVKNRAAGFAFVTNQELRVSEREILKNIATNVPVEVFHLERISQILDSPAAYGIRLEFLDITMSQEEQVSFFSWLEDRNSSLIDSAFRSERKLIEDEQLRRARVSLKNYSVVLFPKIYWYETMVYYLTTPHKNRGDGNNRVYNPNFNLSDMQDLFQSAFLNKFPLYEPTIDRYIKVQQQLCLELVDLIKHVDHTAWPTLPVHCQGVLTAMAQYDYSEALLGNEKMYAGNKSLREQDVERLKKSVDDDLVIKSGDMFNQYRALAKQIKVSMPLLREIQQLIQIEMQPR